MEVRLGAAPFEFLQVITLLEPDRMVVEARVERPEHLLEAMAQAAGLHARWLLGFDTMVLFAAVEDYRPYDGTPGKVTIEAALRSGGERSYAYGITARMATGERRTAVVHFMATDLPMEPRLREFFVARFRRLGRGIR